MAASKLQTRRRSPLFNPFPWIFGCVDLVASADRRRKLATASVGVKFSGFYFSRFWKFCIYASD